MILFKFWSAIIFSYLKDKMPVIIFYSSWFSCCLVALLSKEGMDI